MSKKLLLISLLVLPLLACHKPSKPEAKTGGLPGEVQTQSAKQNQGVNENLRLDIWPRLKSPLGDQTAVEAKVTRILKGMRLEQKVAQMIQPEIRDISANDMRKYGFGSYLNGGGSFPDGNKQATPKNWINLAESMYQASIDDSLDGSTIPTMWGTDAVHGHNNVIGATLFPHNIGLGAARNPDLIKQIAQVTAKEVMVTGIDWVFAPTVATVRDDRWGRTYESYSEDPVIVKQYAEAIVKGLQGDIGKDFLADDKVISTVKHFIGDGGTIAGDDQGDSIASEEELFNIHGQGYVGGLSAGAQSVMASFNSWHGKKLHGHKYLLTQVLKNRMGFDGFVVGDWLGHGQISGCTNENCPQAINAGLDIFMVPTGAWKPLLENTVAQVKSGQIPLSRIDDAVRRILRVKVRMGLFDKLGPAQRMYSGKTELIGNKAHRELARKAVRESLVLLKNKNKLLPLSPKQHILVAGDGAHNIGKQSGGWTITWQGTGNRNDDFPGASSIYDGIQEQVLAAGGKVELTEDGSFNQKPDVAVVVFGEGPYAEGHGDRENLDFQRGEKTDLAVLKRLKAQGIPVVSIFISGRPMWINAELNASDAFVAAWLPGSEGNGIADVILRRANEDIQYPMTGKLSFSWPKTPYQTEVNTGDEDYAPLLPYGFGLTYDDENVLLDDLNEVFKAPDVEFASRNIFKGRAIKPWHFWLYSADDTLEVSSNTMSLRAISYRTSDRLVQEDAFKLDWDGSADAGVRFISKSNFREDLRADLESESALRFWVKPLDSIEAPVFVSTQCEGEGECGASIDITAQLRSLSQNQWHLFTIDMRCFANLGMRYADAVIPFSLHTAGKLSLEMSEVSLEPGLAKEAVISCQ